MKWLEELFNFKSIHYSPSSRDVFSTLPMDISKHAIGSFLSARDKAPLRGTSRFFNQLHASNNGKELLQAVVYGDLKTVKAILACDPEGKLLLKPYRVTDYSSRRIHQTAYQAALAAEDEEMAAVIKDHLLQCHGLDFVQAQQEALFPEEEEKAWEVRQQNDLQALDTIIDAIAQANVTIAIVNDRETLRMDETCKQAMADFRKHLESCKSNPITTGRHWNAALLQRAFELYLANLNQFGGDPSSPKSLLVWRQVIGSIQRYTPANYAQAFAQDLYYIIEDHEKLKRSFDFRFNGGSYFPLDANPEFRLGYDGAVGIYMKSNYPLEALPQMFASKFSQFSSDKNSKIAELMAHPGQYSDKAWSCVVM